ncbi:Ig-like domain-containing protein, partial [uncultured Psychromonas sp.]|uniref:Ig-like domain-containing protein n=1 Tax=uncultured Psychromonas sp. TaxID=173974 RepID=UPI00262DC576
MAEQNKPVNENNETEVELTTEQLNQAKVQLNESGEALNSVEPQLPPLVDDDTANANPEASKSANPGEISPEIDIDDLDAILALGEEVFDLDIETAAGEESGGGFTLVDFERDGLETIATTDFQTTGLDDDPSPIVTLTTTDDSSNNINVTENSVPTLTITSSNDFTEDDGSAVEGAVVSTFETTDEDGDEVTVTLSDTINYEIVGNTVVLTEAGAALVNSGEELPAYTLTVNDGTADGESVTDDPSVTTVNDIPTISITSSNDFTEDDGNTVEGAVVSTFETTDEDGDEVTVTLSDTINYEIVGNTVVLTEAGAALVNSGEELPAYTLTVNDGTADGESVTDDPSVTTVDDPTIVNSDIATTNEDTPITIDVLANDTDADGVVSPVASVTDGEYGTVTINDDGTVTYTPDADYNGPDSFTYTNEDGSTETVSVTVEAISDDTVVAADAATTNEDTPITIDVLANDTDADGVVSPVASVTDGEYGTVTI